MASDEIGVALPISEIEYDFERRMTRVAASRGGVDYARAFG